MIQRFITNDAMQVGDRLPDPKAKEKSKDRAKEEVAGEAEDKSKVGGTNNVERFITKNDFPPTPSMPWNKEGMNPKAVAASDKANKFTRLAGATDDMKDHAKAGNAHLAAADMHDDCYDDSSDSRHAVAAEVHRGNARTHALAAEGERLKTAKPNFSKFIKNGEVIVKKLTKNQREEVIEALVANCNCSKEDAEVFNEMEDQTLVGLLAPVINAMDTSKDEEDQDEDQETDETNNEDDGTDMTGDPDAEEDLDDAESGSRSGFGTLKAGGTGPGRPGKGEENKDKAGIDNSRRISKKESKPMTTNQWLASAPPEVRSVVQNAMQFEAKQKKALIKQITSNASNDFTPQYLATKDVAELRAIAKLAAGMNQNQGNEPVPMFNYEGAAGGAVHNAIDPNDDDILTIPTINYAEAANLDPKKMRRQLNANA